MLEKLLILTQIVFMTQQKVDNLLWRVVMVGSIFYKLIFDLNTYLLKFDRNSFVQEEIRFSFYSSIVYEERKELGYPICIYFRRKKEIYYEISCCLRSREKSELALSNIEFNAHAL